MIFNKDYLFGQKQIGQMKLSNMKAVGITIHNTANRRHASARDEAKNMYNNNTKKGTAGVAVHFFVDEKETYQMLPLDIHGWHAGDGRSGVGNKRTIAIEICRSLDYSTDRYAKAELRAVELVKWLMKIQGIGISGVKRHYDYATNRKRCPHRMFEGRPNTWEKFKDLIVKEVAVSKPTVPSAPVSSVSLNSIAKEVINGKYGNGSDRVRRIAAAGFNYNDVQAEVNRILGIAVSKPTAKPKPVRKTNQQIANEIYRGQGGWGNNPGRRRKLEAAGYNYNEVQRLVNRLIYK